MKQLGLASLILLLLSSCQSIPAVPNEPSNIRDIRPLLISLEQDPSIFELLRVVDLLDGELYDKYGYEVIAKSLIYFIQHEPELREAAFPLLARYMSDELFEAFKESVHKADQDGRAPFYGPPSFHETGE